MCFTSKSHLHSQVCLFYFCHFVCSGGPPNCTHGSWGYLHYLHEHQPSCVYQIGPCSGWCCNAAGVGSAGGLQGYRQRCSRGHVRPQIKLILDNISGVLHLIFKYKVTHHMAEEARFSLFLVFEILTGY